MGFVVDLPIPQCRTNCVKIRAWIALGLVLIQACLFYYFDVVFEYNDHCDQKRLPDPLIFQCFTISPFHHFSMFHHLTGTMLSVLVDRGPFTSTSIPVDIVSNDLIETEGDSLPTLVDAHIRSFTSAPSSPLSSDYYRWVFILFIVGPILANTFQYFCSVYGTDGLTCLNFLCALFFVFTAMLHRPLCLTMAS